MMTSLVTFFAEELTPIFTRNPTLSGTVCKRICSVPFANSRYYSVERERAYQNEEYAQDSEMDSDPFVTWRPRRALPREYFIEIMVVADAKMVEYHGTGLVGYILVLMSTVGIYSLFGNLNIFNFVSQALTPRVTTVKYVSS